MSYLRTAQRPKYVKGAEWTVTLTLNTDDDEPLGSRDLRYTDAWVAANPMELARLLSVEMGQIVERVPAKQKAKRPKGGGKKEKGEHA